ncbi:MAG: hypothetical protein ACKO3T_24480 [Planctomycetaceae bacterium]
MHFVVPGGGLNADATQWLGRNSLHTAW